ncbi:MAG: flavin reductase [Arthrobacter sp.]|nr:flavin reductase [Arthrobacter sp.]
MTTQTLNTDEPLVDPMVFRNVVGHFASGVTVITTVVDGEPFGTTASAVSSLSMEPPMMLACLNRSSSTHDQVVAAGRFAINILAEDQAGLAMHFGRKGSDKFAGIGYTMSEHGLPLLDGALATVECRIGETATGGTHTVFLGVVEEAGAADKQPLAYYRGTMGRLERVLEVKAYDGVREWVLRRKTPLGAVLDPVAIGEAIRSEPEQVQNALVKLTSEGLVFRNDEGLLEPTPITAETTDAAYDGRATIESGVIFSHLDRVSAEDVAELGRLAGELAALRAGDAAELESFLALNVAFHDRLVSVAGSAALVDAFRRLGIGTVWRQALTAEEWARQMETAHVVDLAAALAAGDSAAAQDALAAHTAFGKNLAREVIARHGGRV